MERSALYRRALAPLMVVAGVVGIATAAAGFFVPPHSLQGFVLTWLAACLFAQVICLLMVRRQALKENEEFWTLPCRQVTRAVLPPFASGAMLAAVVLAAPEGVMPPLLLAGIWASLHACALHAAGSFMKRGIRLFAWIIFAAAVLACLGSGFRPSLGSITAANAFMGFVFGFLHLVFGIYLYSTEQGTGVS